MKYKRNLVVILIFCLILFWFLIRLISNREIDDVHPSISCDMELLGKSDILWVIPLFDNLSIADNGEWCLEIFNLNKTLGMHGVYHTYRELEIKRDREYIDKGIKAFEECFGFKPEIFKPSHLAISSGNLRLLENMGFDVKGRWNQIFHKVYHCSDTGKFSNKIIDLF